MTDNAKLVELCARVGAREIRHSLDGRACLIGSSAECDLCLPDPTVSRRHAMVRIDDGALVIEDLGSSNGSYINGKRVLRGEAKVGDELAFDVLRFRVAGSAVQAEPVHVVATSARAKKKASRPVWPWLLVLAVVAGGAAAAMNFLR